MLNAVIAIKITLEVSIDISISIGTLIAMLTSLVITDLLWTGCYGKLRLGYVKGRL
jgi:hypothetical protein